MNSLIITRDNIHLTDATLQKMIAAAAKAHNIPQEHIMVSYTNQTKFMLMVKGQLIAMFDKESFDTANNITPEKKIFVPNRGQ